MSDANAVRKRQAQVELCRDLLLSTVHNSLTSFRRAILASIDEHNKDLPLTKRVGVIRNDQDLRVDHCQGHQQRCVHATDRADSYAVGDDSKRSENIARPKHKR